ncbi:winged helix-turn-helix domain-containing tetratricopeptide repeat protein [Rhodanobacter umsongensis]
MVETENPVGWIVFDAVEIDLGGRRLFVAGADVPLEPKAFAVLALLARHPGRAFGRDEILDAVWGHRHVTPGVLNRVVTLLRHALGERFEDQHYLHTLHGIGYRFDAQVRLLDARPVLSDAHVGTTSAEPIVSAPALAPVLDAVDIRPASVPSATGDTLADSTISSTRVADTPSVAHPALASPRMRMRAAVILCMLLTAVAGSLLLHHTSSSVPAASPVLVVLPLRAIGADSNETAFADGLSEDLTTRLAHVNGLRLISSVSALRAQQDGFDARQLAERLHVTHAIEGSLHEAGDQLRIGLRLIETPSGRTLWTQDYDRKFADVFALQQDIVQAVASALALHIDITHTGEATVDPQVFREYLELRHVFLAQSDSVANTKAETALNALAARAPDFAPVHGLLALNLASGFEDDGKDNDALHEARHALDLDPSDIYAHAALGMVAAHSHDWVTAKKEYDAAFALSPGDPIMRTIIGMWLGRLGYGEQALSEFETVYSSDPLSYWDTYNRATELDTLGRHDEAKHFLDLLPGLESEPGWFTVTARWRNAVWRRDYTAARNFARQISSLPSQGDEKTADANAGVAFAAVTEALLDPARWPKAEAAIAALEAKAGGASSLRLFAPQLSAAPLLAAFEPGDQQPNGKLLWTVDFTALHRDPAFQGFLQRMKFIDYWHSNGWPPQCKPEGDGARCE